MNKNASVLLAVLIVALSGCVPVTTKPDAKVEHAITPQRKLEPGERVILYEIDSTPDRKPGDGGDAFLIAACNRVREMQGPHPAFRDSLDVVSSDLRVIPWDAAVYGSGAENFAIPWQDNDDFLTFPSAAERRPPSNLQISEEVAKSLFELHAGYLLFVSTNTDYQVHVPAYLPAIGVAACAIETVARAMIWELPSGRYLGNIVVSAKGEYVLAQYIVGVRFIPQSEISAMEKLAREIVKLLDGS